MHRTTDRFWKCLEKLPSYIQDMAKDDPINFAKSVFPKSKQYLFEVLTEVIDEFHQEEQLSDISAESLKGMLLFLYSLTKFKEPEISISETGVFYIDWEEEINNSLTVKI